MTLPNDDQFLYCNWNIVKTLAGAVQATVHLSNKFNDKDLIEGINIMVTGIESVDQLMQKLLTSKKACDCCK